MEPKAQNSNTRKKKIALLINSFWNSGAGISGGDQRVMQIFKRLENKFDLDIYTTDDGQKVIKKEIIKANYIISPIKIEKGNILLRYKKRSNWLMKKISEKKYDIIYSSSDFFPDVSPAFVHKKNHPKTKWIACIFHIYPDWRRRPGNKIVNLVGSKIQNVSFGKIKSLADRIININYHVQDELINKYHFDKNKISLNPCGIDLEYFEKIKSVKKRNQTCFIARLVPSKGIFDLPEIWSRVTRKIPSAKLKIIGGGSNEIKSKLQSLVDNLGLSKNIEILGFLPNDAAYKILKSSELFVFPSHEEGFGIAIAEAFAASTPVIAWDLPVYGEAFNRSVKTVSIGDTESFARETISLLKNPKELSRLVSQGRNVIRKYSWQGITQNELKIINQLINEK